MNQILLGASFPFVLGLLVYLLRRCRASLSMLILTPIVIAFSCIWAVVPDLPRLVGRYDIYSRYAMDPRCNIFYWHYTIDMTESDSSLYGLGLVLLFLALVAAAWRELRIEEDR